MKTRIVIFVTAVTALGILGGCDRARTASEVAADTASAEQSAMQKDAAAAKDANEKVTKAGQEVRSDRRQLTHEAAVQNQKLAETDAAGAHKVAIAQCEALSGQAQSICKKQADADLDVAMAVAKQVRTRQDPDL
jgi:hypothetical protein